MTKFQGKQTDKEFLRILEPNKLQLLSYAGPIGINSILVLHSELTLNSCPPKAGQLELFSTSFKRNQPNVTIEQVVYDVTVMNGRGGARGGGAASSRVKRIFVPFLSISMVKT